MPVDLQPGDLRNCIGDFPDRDRLSRRHLDLRVHRAVSAQVCRCLMAPDDLFWQWGNDSPLLRSALLLSLLLLLLLLLLLKSALALCLYMYTCSEH